MTDALALKKFTEFKERTGSIDDAELDDFWASLPPATVDGMLGEWKGGEFVTGHRMNGQLEKSRWFGKTFNSSDDVQPLVCLDDDGNRFSNVKMGKGEASLWLEEFRGEVTATGVDVGGTAVCAQHGRRPHVEIAHQQLTHDLGVRIHPLVVP